MAQRPPDISAQQRRINELLRQRDFNKFSDNLSDILTDIWITLGTAGIQAVREYLRTARGPMRKVVDESIEILQGFMSTDYAAQINPVVNGSVKHVYALGANEVRVGLGRSFNLVDRRAVRFLHEHHMYWSLNHYDSHVTERIKRLADTAIKNGLSRENAGRFFQNTIGRELKRDQAYWELTADAITTRSRSFGSIEGLVKAGATRYQWDSVIDHRTSHICRTLDGRVFEVAPAVEARDRMIAAKTPEEAKEIMPWIPEKEFREMSFDQVKDAGLLLPPAHGRCRAKIVIA